MLQNMTNFVVVQAVGIACSQWLLKSILGIIIKESTETPYVGMNQISPSHNTVYLQPYLMSKRVFPPKVR